MSHLGTPVINSTWSLSCFLKWRVPITCRVLVCWMRTWVWAQSRTAWNNTTARTGVPSSLNCLQEVFRLLEEQMLNKRFESTPNYYPALSMKLLTFPGWPSVLVWYWTGSGCLITSHDYWAKSSSNLEEKPMYVKYPLGSEVQSGCVSCSEPFAQWYPWAGKLNTHGFQ